MKKLICLTGLMLLAACSGESFQSKTKDTKACLLQKAEAYVADGTAFASPVKTTVQKMLVACLTPAEQTPEMQQLAQGILTNLMKAKENQ